MKKFVPIMSNGRIDVNYDRKVREGKDKQKILFSSVNMYIKFLYANFLINSNVRIMRRKFVILPSNKSPIFCVTQKTQKSCQTITSNPVRNYRG